MYVHDSSYESVRTEKDIEIGTRTLKIFGYKLANQKREVSLASQSNNLKIIRQQLPMDQ
jgi:hypothetical protein